MFLVSTYVDEPTLILFVAVILLEMMDSWPLLVPVVCVCLCVSVVVFHVLDGRIKPDVLGVGHKLMSADSDGNPYDPDSMACLDSM